MQTSGRLLILTALLILAGCENKADRNYGLGLNGDVMEVKLSDGTRCVVFTGYYKGGITCDWSRR